MFRLRSSLAWFYEETFRWGLVGAKVVERLEDDRKTDDGVDDVGIDAPSLCA